MSNFINTIDALGDEAVFASLVDRSITEYADDIITELGSGAFYLCGKLTNVNLPAVTKIGDMCFNGCSELISVNLPLVNNKIYMTFDGCSALTSISLPFAPSVGYLGFRGCSSLTTVNMPVATKIETWGFQYCSSLSILDMPAVNSIAGMALENCTSLDKLVLRNNAVCSLDSSAFNNTPIAAGSGYIFVPASLVGSYKTATNWSAYANQIRAIEDYTVDGTVTGDIAAYNVEYMLSRITCDCSETLVSKTFYATLTPANSAYSMGDAVVVVTMDGVDITSSVYSNGVINIPNVTGDISISARFVIAGGFTLEGYLADGLTWHLDGIDNTGSGHSNTATRWVDLVNGRSLIMTNPSTVTWGEDCLNIANNVAYCNNIPVDGLTVELLFQNTRVANHVYVATFATNDNSPAHILALNSGNCATFVSHHHQYTNLGVSYTDKMAITIVYSSENGDAEKVYINGIALDAIDNASLLDNWGNAMTTMDGADNKQYLKFGDYSSGTGNATYHMDGSIYSFRAYNRKLTEAEIQQNYAVDVERFGLTS